MSEPTPTTQVTTTKTQTMLNELADDEVIIRDAIAAYKKEGVSGLLRQIPGAIQEVEQDIYAVRDAIPEIKAGYKTTEFWLITLALVGNIVYFQSTGKILPFDLNLITAALLSVYTVTRTIIKRNG